MRRQARQVALFSVIAGMIAAGCAPSAEDVQADTVYPVGACLSLADGPDPSLHPDLTRSFEVFELRDCNGPHTHVVLALAKWEDGCPTGTDDVLGLTHGTTPYRCLRAETTAP